MRLINTSTLRLESIDPSSPPPYAILSHTWGNDEVSFADMCDPSKASQREAFPKLLHACNEARARGFGYIWIDTCCIDKSSSAELSEAINSMYRWYQNAAVCFIFLSDVDLAAGRGEWEDHLRYSRWFYRGWTLQELIAPRLVKFFDRNWKCLGTKQSLLSTLCRITGIDREVLEDPECLPDVSVARRMSWAAQRRTSRTEDTAYCLLGIFDVHMPMIYGEGNKAFSRLQEEILKVSGDASLFAWNQAIGTDQQYRGLLAESPEEFLHFANYSYSGPLSIRGDVYIAGPCVVIDGVFEVENPGLGQDEVLLRLFGLETTVAEDHDTGIRLRRWKGRYVRVSSRHPITLKKQVEKEAAGLTLATKIHCLRSVDKRTSKQAACEISDEMPQADKRHEKADTDVQVSEQCRPIKVEANTISPRPARTPSREGEQPEEGPQQNPEAADNDDEASILLGDIASETDDESHHGDEESEQDDPDIELLATVAPPRPVLDPAHPLAKYIDELSRSALDAFLKFLSVTPSQVPSKRAHDQPSSLPMSPRSRKRLRDSSLQQHVPVADDDSATEPGAVWVSLPPRPQPALLACPFYRRDPVAYRQCLAGAELRSVADVRAHVAAAHRRPVTCPVCGVAFGTTPARDVHIRARSCELAAAPAIEGITDAQVRQLSRRRRGRAASDGAEWAAIWRIVFPRAGPPPAPYLSSRAAPVESVVCMLRAFWAAEGGKTVRAFLETHAIASEYDAGDGGVATLKSVILDRLIDGLVAEFQNDEAGEEKGEDWPAGMTWRLLRRKLLRYAQLQ